MFTECNGMRGTKIFGVFVQKSSHLGPYEGDVRCARGLDASCSTTRRQRLDGIDSNAEEQHQ
eukprot:6880150-Prymnesium_polylepis.1